MKFPFKCISCWLATMFVGVDGSSDIQRAIRVHGVLSTSADVGLSCDRWFGAAGRTTAADLADKQLNVRRGETNLRAVSWV